MIAVEIVKRRRAVKLIGGVGAAQHALQHLGIGGASGLGATEKAVAVAIEETKPARQVLVPACRVGLAVHENVQADQHRPAIAEEEHILHVLHVLGGGGG